MTESLESLGISLNENKLTLKESISAGDTV